MYYTFTLLFLLHAHHESWTVSTLFRENKRTWFTDFPAISGMALREQVEGSKGLREREGQHLPGECLCSDNLGDLEQLEPRGRFLCWAMSIPEVQRDESLV